MNRAGANLSIGRDGAEVEASHATPACAAPTPACGARTLACGARTLACGARTLACRVHTRVNACRYTNARFLVHPSHYLTHAFPAPPPPHLSRQHLAVPDLASAWQRPSVALSPGPQGVWWRSLRMGGSFPGHRALGPYAPAAGGHRDSYRPIPVSGRELGTLPAGTVGDHGEPRSIACFAHDCTEPVDQISERRHRAGS